MRAAVPLMLAASLLLAACAEPTAAPAPEGEAPKTDGGGRVSRGGAGVPPDDGRNQTLLGSDHGSGAGPGRFPFTVLAPAGGAAGVTWSLTVTPVASPVGDTVEGPGPACTIDVWYTSFVASGVNGRCADLAAGTHGFAVVLNEPVLDYTVEVLGWVGAGNGTAAAATET